MQIKFGSAVNMAIDTKHKDTENYMRRKFAFA